MSEDGLVNLSFQGKLIIKKGIKDYMTTPSDSSTSIKVLKETIAWFKKQIEPHDCGWMYTTIHGLKHRIKELRKGRHDH